MSGDLLRVVTVARKPLSEPTVAWNVLKWGAGAFNIDACRIPADEAHEKNMASVVSAQSSSTNSNIPGLQSLRNAIHESTYLQ